MSEPLLQHDDRILLFRTRQCLPRLFDDFNEDCVLVHGNLSLRSMLKDPRSDQLLAMLNSGTLLWAPWEYDLSRLCEEGLGEALLFHYLSRAPVAEAFLCRRWLYTIWEAATPNWPPGGLCFAGLTALHFTFVWSYLGARWHLCRRAGTLIAWRRYR